MLNTVREERLQPFIPRSPGIVKKEKKRKEESDQVALKIIKANKQFFCL